MSAADDRWVTRLCASENACPEPAAVASLAPVKGTARPANERLARHRSMTNSDRLLLWSDQAEVKIDSGAGSALDEDTLGLAAYALTSGADVWLVSPAHADRAAELVDRLDITLCADTLAAAHDSLALRCLGVAGEPVGCGQTGWLTWGASASEGALSVGYVDDAGWAHVLGAADQALAAPDGLLTPFEGAQRLRTHPRVTRACLLSMTASQCAAVGVEAGFFGVAEVVGRATPVLEVELLDYVRQGLSAAKCPQGIVCVTDLPTRLTGAPDTAALDGLVEREFSASAVPPAS